MSVCHFDYVFHFFPLDDSVASHSHNLDVEEHTSFPLASNGLDDEDDDDTGILAVTPITSFGDIMRANSESDLDHDKRISQSLSETLELFNGITNEEDLPVTMQAHYQLFYEDLKNIHPEVKKKDNSHLKDCDKKHGHGHDKMEAGHGHGHGEDEAESHGHGEEDEDDGHAVAESDDSGDHEHTTVWTE